MQKMKLILLVVVAFLNGSCTAETFKPRIDYNFSSFKDFKFDAQVFENPQTFWGKLANAYATALMPKNEIKEQVLKKTTGLTEQELKNFGLAKIIENPNEKLIDTQYVSLTKGQATLGFAFIAYLLAKNAHEKGFTTDAGTATGKDALVKMRDEVKNMVVDFANSHTQEYINHLAQKYGITQHEVVQKFACTMAIMKKYILDPSVRFAFDFAADAALKAIRVK
jgi:hypothetical protein